MNSLTVSLQPGGEECADVTPWSAGITAEQCQTTSCKGELLLGRLWIRRSITKDKSLKPLNLFSMYSPKDPNQAEVKPIVNPAWVTTSEHLMLHSHFGISGLREAGFPDFCFSLQ